MSSAARQPVATVHVAGAMAALILVLAILAPHYGYHRDELYFRMLPPAWGYTDQPPLTPFLVRTSTAVLGDTLLALRLPAILFAAASIPLLTLVTREVGGGRHAQALTAWGMAGATMTLLFGHVLLTASLGLVVWPAVLLCVIRALLRDEGRWWLVAGVIVGLSTVNKLLIVVLLVGIALGIVVCGPRRWLRSPWLWAGVVVTGLLAVPAALYQASNGWPQLAMGAALGENNAAEVRIMMWPFLILLVGPVTAVFWVVAVVAIFRRPAWRALRFLPLALVVVVVFVFVSGAQFYYTAGVLAVLTAVGAVPVAEWAATAERRSHLRTAIALNAAGCVATTLPVFPLPSPPATVVAGMNESIAEQIGWQRYADQIGQAAADAGADAIITSNYGEAGALDRFGAPELPPVHSGHNALWEAGAPAGDVEVVLIVGEQIEEVSGAFETCGTLAHLDNGVGIDNEEQGRPLTVCRTPVAPWPELWPDFRHLD